jgi:hypothetical protein
MARHVPGETVAIAWDNRGVWSLVDPGWVEAWQEVARDCPPPPGLYDKTSDWTGVPNPVPGMPYYIGWLTTPSG